MKFNEEYYGVIAQLLNDFIPVKWEKIWLCAEIGDESVATFFYYLTEDKELLQGGTICDDFNVSNDEFLKFNSQLVRTLQDLNDDYVKNGQEKWTIMTFSLDSDWKFKTDYQYEDLGETSARKRRKVWKEKYLNLDA